MAATARAVDFSNVKDAGAFSPKHKPEGDYKGKIVKVEDHKSNAGNESWVFTVELPSDRRATYPYYCGVDEKQAWKIRNLLIAAGMNVPKKRVKVDPNKLINKEIGMTLEDDEYEGKLKSVISAVFPTDELTDDEPAATTSKAKKGKAAAPADDDDDDDEDVSDEDMDELDLEEI